LRDRYFGQRRVMHASAARNRASTLPDELILRLRVEIAGVMAFMQLA
jgi:hypothetical protein